MATTTAPDGTSIEYDLTGEGPPLVLVHGITESAATWEPLLPRLAGTHRVLAVDLRGHSRSGRTGPYDLATFAGDVHAAVTDAGLGDDAVLVGHSLGGTVVTAYASALPCRAVVNIDQPLALAGFQAGLRQLEPMLRGDREAFVQAMEMVFSSMQGELTGAAADRVAAIRQPDQEVVLGVWSVVLDSDAAVLDAMVASVTATIGVPYLALHGIDPGPEYPEWLGALLPTATLEVWDGLGHYPHLVAPDRFLDRLAAFEASLPPTALPPTALPPTALPPTALPPAG